MGLPPRTLSSVTFLRPTALAVRAGICFVFLML